MPAPTIYYIRHGETEWNAAGRFQGSQDIPLNARGEGQATHAGAVLADLLARDGRDAASLAFVASPLGRARATMERVRAALGLPGSYALDDRLREIGYGHWEGATLVQMQASHPDIYAERERDKWGVAPPGGGESYASVTLRVRDWYDSLTGDTVAVAHGGTARALMVATGLRTPLEAADIAIAQGAVYVFTADTLTLYS